MINHYRKIVPGFVLLAGIGVWGWLAWLERAGSHAPYSLIEDRLYVGALVKTPPPGTNAVLNLCDNEHRYDVDIRLIEPIDGSIAPSIEQLTRMVEFIDTQRRAGRTIYVHCLAGMNRSGMLVTAYLMHEHHWTRAEALAFAQAKRPQLYPNPIMMRLLAEWEVVLKERGKG